MKRRALLLPIGAIILNACSVVNGMKKMEKSTKDMNETTHEMSDTTGRMEQKTSEMSEDTKQVRQATQDMLTETRQMNETTREMQGSTEKVAEVTADMAKTTEEMAATTEDLKATSDELHKATINLYDDNRQGASLALRNSAREQMRETNDQLTLIGYAAHYYMAFEFQLWKGMNSDNGEKLDVLKHDAVEELIRTVYEFLPDDRSISPLSKHQARRSLYAFCAALHIVNSNGTLQALEAPEYAADDDETSASRKTTSVLDLLMDGLAAKAKIESGEMLPGELKPHQKAVLEHEGVVVYLLQVRANFIAAMTAQQLATTDGHAISTMTRIRDLLMPWTAKTKTRNVVELAKYLELLESAQTTRQFLLSVGAQAPLDRRLKRFLKMMRFAQAETLSAPALRGNLVRKLESAVAALLD